MSDPFAEWEEEKAARRRADFERGVEAFREKARREQEKIDAGIGVETPEETASYETDGDDDQEEEDAQG